MKKITLILFFLVSHINFAQTFGVIPYASGFSHITEIANAGDSRLFVVQQTGEIKIVNPLAGLGVVNATDFLTLPANLINYGGENGLLGLAFHPNYASNGYFYVNYTRPNDGASVIERYTTSTSNPDVALADSGVILMAITQAGGVHNGGTMKFGPDGYLYISVGDAATYVDPKSLAQDLNSNRGKILRIDVDPATYYGIPPNNPFATVAGNDEIWALGFRNPWKFSFNRQNGDLWIADVGQNTQEEVNKVASPLPDMGLNFGWRCYEGNFSYNIADCGDFSSYVAPLLTYASQDIGGCAVTGGYYYTGSQYPNFNGNYIFGDFCASKIMSLTDDGTLTVSPTIPGLSYLTTFGEDVNGELYVAAQGGIVYRIVDATLGINSFAENGLSLYPNPAKSEVSITNTSNKILSQFRLYDLSGKLLLEQKMSDLATTTINTGALQSGLYVATVEDVSGAKFSSKLVIK
jgi:glucose/arabinose dehydrogenase